MGEISLDDLIGGDDGDDEQGMAGSLENIINMLDDRGYLQPLLFGIDADSQPNTNTPQPMETNNGDGPSSSEAPQVDAKVIIAALKQVGDMQSYDMTVAELIELAEGNEAILNHVIKQQL